MGRILVLFTIGFLGCFFKADASAASTPNELILAVASDFKPAVEEIASEFSKIHPGIKISVTPGSSGKLYEQIRTGAAPFDIFFSADMNYPQKLVAEGESKSKVVPYAVGKLIAWSPTLRILSSDDLKKTEIKKIAVANFDHAPYGMRAKEFLERAKIFESVKAKLVTAESVAQAAQFAETGAADVALVAYSFIFSPALNNKGHYFLIPESLYTPLVQGMLLLKKGEAVPNAKLFADYISSATAKKILKKYGFGQVK